MTTREADGLSAEVESEKTFVLVAYVLHLAGSMLGRAEHCRRRGELRRSAAMPMRCSRRIITG